MSESVEGNPPRRAIARLFSTTLSICLTNLQILSNMNSFGTYLLISSCRKTKIRNFGIFFHQWMQDIYE